MIGTDATGTRSLGNAQEGVELDVFAGSSTDNTIGGLSANAGNLITDNGGAGVAVGGDSSVGNQITANRIFANTGQAIDLGDDGVTDNSATPRQGPNNFQNFPIIVTTASGQIEGGLDGSTPDTTFRIDLFASAAYGPDGAGEAEDYLGSLDVTTDSQGQATFDVPFSPPADLPVVTATATDPQGNTSEVSAVRRATLQAPSLSVRAAANQSLAFAAKSGDGIAIQDPDAGPLNPSWHLALSVSGGTLTLSSPAGLTGSGDGTGSLSFSGPLTTIDAALQGMLFDPPAGPLVLTNLTLDAQSDGAPALQTQFTITDGVFVVDTTADSGQGSLRQAILDANSVIGLAITIDFAIPGAGVQTIESTSPLPPISASVLIDGTSQPGFAGTPLIAFASQSPGSSGPLAVSGGNVTIRGLALESVTIDATADESLIAVVAAHGTTSQLSLLDEEGHVLVQSEGVSTDNPDDVIDQDLSAGAYSLALERGGGQGTYTWSTTLTPAAAPFQPIPVGELSAPIVAGDFNGDKILDIAVGGGLLGSGTVSILLGNGDGTFQPAVEYAFGFTPVAIVARDFTGDGRLDLAVADSEGVQILMGNGDGTFQPAQQYGAGSGSDAIVAGDFNGDGRLDLAVADSDGVQILMGNGDGTFQPARTVESGIETLTDEGRGALVAGDFNGDGRTDLAVVNANSYGPGSVSVLLGNGDGTFQPAGQHTRWGRTRKLLWRVTSTGTVRPTWPSLGLDTTCRCCWATATAPSNPRSPTRWRGLYRIVAGDFNGDGRTDLAVSTDFDNHISVLLGNGDGTFQPAMDYWTAADAVTLVAGDFSGDGRTDLAVVNIEGDTCRSCWATATAPSRTCCRTRWGSTLTPSWRVTSTETASSTWP